MIRPNFNETMMAFRSEIEVELDRWLPEDSTAPSVLHSAMRHSIKAGGKRLRPVLVCAFADCLGSDVSALPAAAAVECLHTYSLIHDDLPAMDNSDLRRGQPTCHKAFGEATAILAGDALLTLAFEILVKGYSDLPDIASMLVADLAQAAGSISLVGGQMEDIQNEGIPITAATLYTINRKKTGALIATSCCLGARVGGAQKEGLEASREFGYLLGEAFQVVDDILDFTASEESTGKTAGQDANNGKTTVVSLLGLEKARNEADRLTRSASDVLNYFKGDTAFLHDLIDWLAKRTS
ncbi:MAG: polyprenyl synthetase family protein [Verrucomicrobiota bacterium]